MRTRPRSHDTRRSRRPVRRAHCRPQSAHATVPVSPRQLQIDFEAAAAVQNRRDECVFCREHLGQPCRPCERLARRIYALVVEGVDLESVAQQLALTVEFAGELLAEQRDRVELADTRVAPVANAGLRRLCEGIEARDPRIYVRIAQRGGWASPSDVRRLLGLQKTSRKTVRGRTYPGRFLTHIPPHAAGRIARALGLLPLQVDWPEVADYLAIRPVPQPR